MSNVETLLANEESNEDSNTVPHFTVTTAPESEHPCWDKKMKGEKHGWAES